MSGNNRKHYASSITSLTSGSVDSLFRISNVSTKGMSLLSRVIGSRKEKHRKVHLQVSNEPEIGSPQLASTSLPISEQEFVQLKHNSSFHRKVPSIEYGVKSQSSSTENTFFNSDAFESPSNSDISDKNASERLVFKERESSLARGNKDASSVSFCSLKPLELYQIPKLAHSTLSLQDINSALDEVKRKWRDSDPPSPVQLPKTPQLVQDNHPVKSTDFSPSRSFNLNVTVAYHPKMPVSEGFSGRGSDSYVSKETHADPLDRLQEMRLATIEAWNEMLRTPIKTPSLVEDEVDFIFDDNERSPEVFPWQSHAMRKNREHNVRPILVGNTSWPEIGPGSTVEPTYSVIDSGKNEEREDRAWYISSIRLPAVVSQEEQPEVLEVYSDCTRNYGQVRLKYLEIRERSRWQQRLDGLPRFIPINFEPSNL